jgi:glycosyltransferase involved in cell wall biosynthesis
MSTTAPFQRLRQEWPNGPLLSVVVISYEMNRELPRALHSLSARYQKDVADTDYEVIVVDNGSSRAPSEAEIKSFGANFTLVLPDSPSPSPCPAMNQGVSRAASPLVAIMLDGAYILSPRVIATSLDAVAAYPGAIVNVPRFYLGPGQQGATIALGYDQDVEDQLLELSGWPHNGYGLFDYSSLIGHDRNSSVLGPPFESSFLVLTAELYKNVGGYEERFDEPGGGFGNIDFFARVAGKCRTCVNLLGEGIFHQLHGGATTNVSRSLQKQKVERYSRRYEEIRRRPWQVPRMTRAFYGTVKIRSSVAAQRTGINDQTVERMEEFLSCQERDLGLA